MRIKRRIKIVIFKILKFLPSLPSLMLLMIFIPNLTKKYRKRNTTKVVMTNIGLKIVISRKPMNGNSSHAITPNTMNEPMTIKNVFILALLCFYC
jgi:ABC-type proline/glycine betaine transport system permease subunit